MKRIKHYTCYWTTCFLTIFVLSSCSTNKAPKDEDVAIDKELVEVGDSELLEILERIYGIPADSVKLLEEAAKVRCSYSFEDMVTDDGQLDWDDKKDDPFITRHLLCEEDMLNDTLMYRLVDDMICSKDYYEGDLPNIYDWMWYDAMKDEIHTYLSTIYPDREQFYATDYVGVLNRMAYYVQPLGDSGGNTQMEQCNQVNFFAVAWLLIAKYKEVIKLVASSPTLTRAYLEDYRLWQEIYNFLIAYNLPDFSYRQWYMECYVLGEMLMTFRLEMLDEEIAYLNGKQIEQVDLSDYKSRHHGDIEPLDELLEMRKAVGDSIKEPWFLHMTYRIWNRFWEKELATWPSM